jgi:hypothetical protein
MQKYQRNAETRLPIGGGQPSLTPEGQSGFGMVNPVSGRQGMGTPGFQGQRNFEEMYGDPAKFTRQPPPGPDSTDYNGLKVSDSAPQGALGITPPDAISTGVLKAKEMQSDEIAPSNLGAEGPEFRDLNDKRIIKKLMEIMNHEV